MSVAFVPVSKAHASADASLLHTSLLHTSSIAPLVQKRAGTSGDSDRDGIDDINDIDDDNDTITDANEGSGDTDGDGIPDCLDRDSDNDGITDLIESLRDASLLRVLDIDGNGELDATVAVGANGLADVAETAPDSSESVNGFADSDEDGIRDQLDLDSDNDGLADVVESGGVDADTNGRLDLFRDIDADGLDDQRAFFPIEVRDTDADGIFNFRDRDSDADGLSDRLEGSGTDVDNNGLVDNFSDGNNDGLYDGYNVADAQPFDTDRDGMPDYIDFDSDNDGISDAVEGFSGATNPNPDPVEPQDPSTQNPAGPSDDPITLVTGENGNVFGCSLGTNSSTRHDPLLWSMVLLSLLWIARRHLKPACGIAALCFLVAGCASPALAPPGATRDANAAYAGIGVGMSFLNASTSGTPLVQDQDFSPAMQLTLGYTPTRNTAVEFRVADLGEATFTNGQALGYQVVDFSALYRHGFSSRITGFARLGAGALSNDGDINADQANPYHVVVGAGASVRLNRSLDLRAEWMGHDTDFSHGQLSLLYKFGATRRAPVQVARNETPTVATESEVAPGTSESQAVVIARSGRNVTPAEKTATAKPRVLERIPRIVQPPATPPADTRTDEQQLAVTRLPEPTVIDSDDDGVADEQDACPTTGPGVIVSQSGCVLIGGPVAQLEFIDNSDTLSASSMPAIDELSQILKDQPGLRLTVVSHVAAQGDERLELLLSRRRALAIVRSLGDRGIKSARMVPEAFGSRKPLLDDATAIANSRIELLVR